MKNHYRSDIIAFSVIFNKVHLDHFDNAMCYRALVVCHYHWCGNTVKLAEGNNGKESGLQFPLKL